MDEGTWLFRFVLLNKYSTITCRMYTVCHKSRTLNVNSRQLDLMWFEHRSYINTSIYTLLFIAISDMTTRFCWARLVGDSIGCWFHHFTTWKMMSIKKLKCKGCTNKEKETWLTVTIWLTWTIINYHWLSCTVKDYPRLF